ncbi:MAG TPA: GNAT family N-acetyltransferase [Rhodospirillaceae bacterium]|nr:MAG: GNAT family N-acetyltransferase [Alphaproteobacteria bacterium GWF2_58_20]HAU28759.1 GNAT family N-acetyltransferase [Rhodospirillaceae bacterium]
MTVRNLDFMFKPKSVAIIGASRRAQSIGWVVTRNLLGAGFDGPIMPVNPKEQSIASVLCYNSIANLPYTPDLAVIATPPATIPGIIRELGERGTKAAVIITAGFSEMGEEGKKLEEELLEAAKPNMVRIVGPNGLGIMVPGINLNASFVHVPPLVGDIAFLAQSGALLSSVVDWATAHKIGFSHLVSLGDMADVDFGDMLDYLTAQPETKSILLYVEQIKNARKFMSAARAASRIKPVIVIKAGRTEEAAKAASSHTGALAGADAVYDAAFRRAGMLRVNDLDEMFAAVETVAMGMPFHGDRLAILTNGGGLGVLATDALVIKGGRLAQLLPETIDKLNAVLPPTWSHGNPVDIIGDASGKRYSDALSILLDDPGADAVLIMNCPTAVADPSEAARATVETLKGGKHAAMTCWMGEGAPAEARKMFAENHIPSFETPNEATTGFLHMVQFAKNQTQLMQAPADFIDNFVPDMKTVRGILEGALAENREWLSEIEAKQVLKCYGIPVVETRKAKTPDEAAEAAKELGNYIAIKILSPDITHKSDVGGVALGLHTPEEVREECIAMLERVKIAAPMAVIEGFTVQQMAHMPDAHELIIGMTEDRIFGPVMLFGQGGTSVEVVKDQNLALPPLNMPLAREVIDGTRISKLLQGYRAQPAAAMDDIAASLIHTSQLISDFAEIAELDINPLLANASGVLAVDARIKVKKVAVQPNSSARLSIRPYPRELEKNIRIDGELDIQLRPIQPEDAACIEKLVQNTASGDTLISFLSPMQSLNSQAINRMCQIDYDREMILAATIDTAGGCDIIGVVRVVYDPDNIQGQFAILVRNDFKRKGLGIQLIQEGISLSKTRKTQSFFGAVQAENTHLLDLCRELGFSQEPSKTQDGIVEVNLVLA